MKNVILTIACLTLINVSGAQDLIIKHDSSRIQARIIEIHADEVKYSLYNYENGPTITTSKSELAYVKFQNGTIERFTARPESASRPYDPNKYNLDQEPVSTSMARQVREPYPIKKEKAKHYEKLYERKSFMGFNFMSYINGNIGFNYMRDFKKANLIVNVPFAFGFAKPHMTNAMYKPDNEINAQGKTTYKRMNYSGGLALLFTPSMNYNCNFLIGPAITFSQFDMNTQKFYYNYYNPSNSGLTFSNDFKLYRLHYGIDVGLQARFNEKLNMSFIITYGYKEDTYSENDPYGVQYASEKGYNVTVSENNNPYVTMALNLGYRF
jgi:hypothetical protein